MRTVLLVAVFSCFLSVSVQGEPVTPGLDVLFNEHPELVAGKRVGVIANHTSVDSAGVHLVDRLKEIAAVAAVFGPEHGFRGDHDDGALIGGQKADAFPIFSLYGDYRMPTRAMLKDVDVLVYDIQDVGVKFYTYTSTMFYGMTAARRDGIPFIVLDRPDPIGAIKVEGPVTHPAEASFVGVAPLPIRYGMTVGELAMMLNRETYLGFGLNADLTVVEMKGYQRDMFYDETGLNWIAPSPNLPTLEAALIYPGMCLLEGTNLSEGRGTDAPFLTVGAPYVDAEQWLAALSKQALTGFHAEALNFTPVSIPGKSTKPKYMDEACHGLRFQVTTPEEADPIRLTVELICAARDLFPNSFKSRTYLDELWGSENLRAMLESGASAKEILKTAQDDLDRFRAVRAKYLLYPVSTP
ncbi:MAG: DUF1343 domain-containing protein [bacterium]|nr:DUF1343 domain-containing protein [bacterium]